MIKTRTTAPASGYISDYVSGVHVKATREQTDAVQVIARRLVVDLGYPIECLQTQPQHRVRRTPSDRRGSYPVDIAVFSSGPHSEQNLKMIVECKSKDRADGLEQLHLYLTMSAATVGVWFNGSDHAYVRKVVSPDGTVRFDDLPSIPRFGERLEDIGQHNRRDLTPASNLRSTFRDLRNHLAANNVGITRDEALASEIINLLFCKIYDEINTRPADTVTFRAGINEAPTAVHERISDLFEAVKTEYDDVFDGDDRIKLDAQSTVYVVGELQNYSITTADRDAVGEAFEVFIGPALRGAEGQFFTPRNVVQLIIEMIDPKPGQMIIDPACGSGGFLIAALAHVWAGVDDEGREKQWGESLTYRRKRDVATRYFRGIDKDMFLAKVTKAYMALIGDGRGGVFCENSLAPTDDWTPAARSAVQLEAFDVVLTNPPFGSKIKVKDRHILDQYHLGHKWTNPKDGGPPAQTERPETSRPPQVLFLERCLQLLKPGGRLGIVLPESMLGMPTHRYVVQYLMSRARVRAVIAMPEPLFKTSGKGGTHTKVCIVLVENSPPTSDYDIFMADAEWCGHDSRGNPTVRTLPDGTVEELDDLPQIARRFRDLYGSPANFWTVP